VDNGNTVREHVIHTPFPLSHRQMGYSRIVDAVDIIILYVVVFSCLGVAYAVVVGPAYLVALAVTRGKPHWSDTWLVAAPIGLYVYLINAVKDRQGFNCYIANLVVAAPVVTGLFIAMNASPDRRARAAAIASGLAAIVAVIAWYVVPLKPPDLF
jgi:hypothetical protein